MTEGRYTDEFPDGTVTCRDCGGVVRDQEAHDDEHRRRNQATYPPIPDPPHPPRTFGEYNGDDVSHGNTWRSRTGL